MAETTKARRRVKVPAKDDVVVVQSEVEVEASIMRNGAVGEVLKDETKTRVHRFITEPAHVTVKAGMTRSLGVGTYEFLRVDVGVSIPCYKEQIGEQTKEAADMVADLLDDEMNSYLGEGGDAQNPK